MQLRESEKTVVTLANAGELVRQISQQVLGNEVADTFNGNELTRGVIFNMAQVKFQGAVAKYVGAN